MKISKRILYFVGTNILIIATLSILMSLLGVQPYLNQRGIDFRSLIAFCLIWGFGGAFISLALSRQMAKWMLGVQVIDPHTSDSSLRNLVMKVHNIAIKAGLTVMPEVGIYESPDLNAFATGPTRNRALVAVSTGLLSRMNESELDGVLAHEITHITNGDMVTMTLVQGVVNALVMFLARIAAWFASQWVEQGKRRMVQFGVTFALEMLLGILGMILVAGFSRAREYRADQGGAKLAGTNSMVAALEALRRHYELLQGNGFSKEHPALSTLQISGKTTGFLHLFATHPPLEERISRLKQRGV